MDGRVLTTLLVIAWLISPAVHQTAASDSSRQLMCLNYGVTFTPVRSIKLVTNVWSRLFDLHLPELPQVNVNFNLAYCDNATSNVQQKDGNRFVTNDHVDFYFCVEKDRAARHTKLLYITDNRVSFRSFHTASSCVSALFMNSVNQVLNLCSFALHENHLQPAVHFRSIPVYYLQVFHLYC